MADQRLATPAEIAALDAWSRDLNVCRERLLQVTNDTLPSFGPLIEPARDATFVQLTQHKTTWGKAVMQLKSNRTKLRSDLIARADEVLAEINKLQQAQLDRRATILSSVIRILP